MESKEFKLMESWIVHIDDAFSTFYNEMLKDESMSSFFENEAQVQDLIEQQKKHFKKTLSMSHMEIKDSYIKLGEYHFKRKIPYIDFIKGTHILEEYFLHHVERNQSIKELIDETLVYFNMMRGYTAKGYLNCMIREDKIDIDSFFQQLNSLDQTYLPRQIVMGKISWLKDLISAIENEENWDSENMSILLKEWLDELQYIPEEKRKFFEDLEERIISNTQNLFYFLKKEEYLEILPLYTSLLSIYKLALMMNNALTLEYATKVIEDMRMDPMTGLFRKEIFSELLEKEMALVNRHPEKFFSLALLDIDNFKDVNDTYGHYSGDKIIEKLGEIIRTDIRSSDLAFRVGGDELAILFRHASLEDAKNVCRKIKDKFGVFEFIFSEKITFHVTLSVGVGYYTSEYKNRHEAFLQEVDQKLYQSKYTGKNTIT